MDLVAKLGGVSQDRGDVFGCGVDGLRQRFARADSAAICRADPAAPEWPSCCAAASTNAGEPRKKYLATGMPHENGPGGVTPGRGRRGNLALDAPPKTATRV